MFLFRFAYRHPNGEVEGFQGCGFTEQAAQTDAERKLRQKCDGIGQPYDPGRRITSDRGLTAAERRTIHQDWEAS